MCTAGLKIFFLPPSSKRVKVGRNWSTRADVLSGISQGSVLGPVLFAFFIDDSPECVQSCHKLVADNAKISESAYNCSNKMHADIYTMQEWSNMWNLLLQSVKLCI